MAWNTIDCAVEEMKKQDVSSKTIIITGGNCGFGYLAAKIMLRGGSTVIIACRSQGKAEEAVLKLKEESGSDKISYLVVDVSDPISIKKFADNIINRKIHFDVLINNAGISCVPEYRDGVTGVESNFQTNFLGPAYLTELLLPYLVNESKQSRIVFVNSCTYPKGHPAEVKEETLVPTKETYSQFPAYFRSKYCLTSYALCLARKHPETTITICDPGTAATCIAREMGCLGWLQSTRLLQWIHPADIGSINISYCGVSNTSGKTGTIYYECKEQAPIPEVIVEAEQEQIFAIAHSLIEKGKKNAMSKC